MARNRNNVQTVRTAAPVAPVVSATPPAPVAPTGEECKSFALRLTYLFPSSFSIVLRGKAKPTTNPIERATRDAVLTVRAGLLAEFETHRGIVGATGQPASVVLAILNGAPIGPAVKASIVANLTR